MHWRDAVIKSKSITWKKAKVETSEDGKLDFTLTLPLTSLFEGQTKKAFLEGMFTMMEFYTQHQADNRPIEVIDLVNLFNDCGCPETAKQFEKHLEK